MAAVSAESVESWLPTEFFTEQELPMDKKAISWGRNEFQPKSSTRFPTEFPYEFEMFSPSLAVNFPVKPVGGSSTETENCDKDDFLAGLTRRLTQQLGGKAESLQNKWVMAGSPESTLSPIGSWPTSNNGSPDGVRSPPRTPFEAEEETLELIFAAAGQVAKLKMCSENNKQYSDYQGKGYPCPAKTHNLVHNTVKNHGTAGAYASHGAYASLASQRCQYQRPMTLEGLSIKSRCPSYLERQQLKAATHAQLKCQPQAYTHPQLIQNKARSSLRPMGLPQSSWPVPVNQPSNELPQQQPMLHKQSLAPQQLNSGARAVFMGGSGLKRASTGTGVFLPRGYGNPPETKKKSAACSTVLLPAKVVQALNINLDDVKLCGHSQSRVINASTTEYDILMARRDAILAQQRHNVRASRIGHDIRLPQEWTY